MRFSLEIQNDIVRERGESEGGLEGWEEEAGEEGMEKQNSFQKDKGKINVDRDFNMENCCVVSGKDAA